MLDEWKPFPEFRRGNLSAVVAAASVIAATATVASTASRVGKVAAGGEQKNCDAYQRRARILSFRPMIISPFQKEDDRPAKWTPLRIEDRLRRQHVARRHEEVFILIAGRQSLCEPGRAEQISFTNKLYARGVLG